MSTFNRPSRSWHGEHSIEAIRKLGRSGARFCRVYEGMKKPIGNAWNKKENTYISEDGELIEHIKNGGNYGVVGGFGDITILDEDDGRITKLRKAKLPETFVVSTCHNDRHSYFTVPNFGGSLRLQDPEDPNTIVGDIQDEGKQVLGPGSIVYPEHDRKEGTGGYYEMINDKAPAFTKQATIKQAFGKFVNVKRKRKTRTENGKQYEATGGADFKSFGIDITEVGKIKEAIDSGELRYSPGGVNGGYYYGSHPVHGSTTGRNFHVLPELNIWKCWRNGHNSTGGPLYWIAIEEGLIDCSEAYKDSPALTGENGWKFRKVLKIAKERGLIDNEVLERFTSKDVGPIKMGEVIE